MCYDGGGEREGVRGRARGGVGGRRRRGKSEARVSTYFKNQSVKTDIY